MKKLAYLMRRVAQGLLVLALIAVINFLLIRAPRPATRPPSWRARPARRTKPSSRSCASASDWTSRCPSSWRPTWDTPPGWTWVIPTASNGPS